MVEHGLVPIQPDEPAEARVHGYLLAQGPLALDGVEGLQQPYPEKDSGRNARLSGGAVALLDGRGEVLEDLVEELPDDPQRMVQRDDLVDGCGPEKRLLNALFALRRSLQDELAGAKVARVRQQPPRSWVLDAV